MNEEQVLALVADTLDVVPLSAERMMLTHSGNTIYDLRQPAYISGVTTGTVSNNHVYRTKGWVVEQGNLTFPPGQL